MKSFSDFERCLNLDDVHKYAKKMAEKNQDENEPLMEIQAFAYGVMLDILRQYHEWSNDSN